MGEHQLAVNDRVQVLDDCATVRFIGQVEGTKGEWLGIEWDDPTRGKHDGTHQGVRYFESQGGPTSSSFIRYHPNKVLTGRSFLEALKDKYLDDAASNTEEYDAKKDIGHVTFGGNKNIKVETVGFEKIQRLQRHLNKLQVVGLAKMQVASAGPKGAIAEQALSIRDLDLSCNLLKDWQAVADIVWQLPKLEILRLNRCRLAPPPTDYSSLLVGCNSASPFSQLTTLSLKSTATSWNDILRLEPLLPNLEDLQIGDNGIEKLSNIHDTQFRKLRCINLEDNAISTWEQVSKLERLQNLQVLYLNGNNLVSIGPVSKDGFAKLQALRVDHNRIDNWTSIDMLNQLPSLTELRCKGNPIFEGMLPETISAQIIGRVKRIKMINGNTLSGRDRSDYERYYLKLCIKDATSKDQITRLHPRYEELCSIHGEPDISVETKRSAATLKDRLVGITITTRSISSTESFLNIQRFEELPETTKIVEKRILTTMLVRNLKHIIQKLLQIPASQQQLYLIQKSPSDQDKIMIMDISDDLRDLKFYGISAGDEILVVG